MESTVTYKGSTVSAGLSVRSGHRLSFDFKQGNEATAISLDSREVCTHTCKLSSLGSKLTQL